MESLFNGYMTRSVPIRHKTALWDDLFPSGVIPGGSHVCEPYRDMYPVLEGNVEVPSGVGCALSNR